MTIQKILSIVLTALFFLGALTVQTPVLAEASASNSALQRSMAQSLKSSAEIAALTSGSCHFAITVPYPLAQYDLSTLGVGSYLDWGSKRLPSVNSNIGYMPVVNVADVNFSKGTPGLSSLLAQNIGATWIIGNEPDSQVAYQDHVSAEVYADRFFRLATAIRQTDPSAKIAFGTVIQPTPVRLFYLSKVIDRLTVLAGDRAKALSLIDIYSIHSFILNEQPLFDSAGNPTHSWGAGVPIGYDPNTWPAYRVISNVDQTVDINIFKDGVIGFRQWMMNLGERNKPLWITEYGSLLPPFANVSEAQSTAYMEQTFNFMLGTKDPNLGFAADSNRLVQKWFWYSLNDKVDHFGGSLYDPSTNHLTSIGTHFTAYQPSITDVPVTDPDVYIDPSTIAIAPGLTTRYRVMFRVGNNISSDRLAGVKVDLKLDGVVIATLTTNIPRCGGSLPLSLDVNQPLTAGNGYNFSISVTLTPGNGTDVDPGNNNFQGPPLVIPTFHYMNLPMVIR